MTEYKQKAEALFPFSDYLANPNCNYEYIIEKMIAFHKELLKEAKTIECLVPVKITECNPIAGTMSIKTISGEGFGKDIHEVKLIKHSRNKAG